eukprot:scaffold4820_cov28-Tisochrysis_lutea.AAC.4
MKLWNASGRLATVNCTGVIRARGVGVASARLRCLLADARGHHLFADGRQLGQAGSTVDFGFLVAA